MGEPTAKLLGDYVIEPMVRFANERLFPEHTRTGDYNSKQWNDWYQKSSLFGTPEFLEHQKFIQQAAPRLEARLQEWDGERRPYARTTRVDAAGNSLDPDNPAEQILRENAIDALLGRPYNRENADSMGFLQDFLAHMRDTSLGGRLSQDTSVTLEGREQMRQEHGSFNLDNRLTPGGAEAMAKLKDYNLFSAFQMGDHKPAAMELPFMAGPLGAIGTLYGGMTGNPGDPIAMTQAAAAAYPSPLNAVKSVMAWDDRGRETDPFAFRDYLSGANIPQASIMNPTGMNRSFVSGDTPYGRATRNMTNFVQMPFQSPETRGALNALLNDGYRFTPIGRPEDFEKDRLLVNAGLTLEDQNYSYLSTHLPRLIRDFNSVFGAGTAAYAGTTPPPPPGTRYQQSDNPYIPARFVELSPAEKDYEALRREESGLPEPRVDPDPYAKIGITPFYGTQALSDLAAVVPNILGDPGNAVVAGAGGAVSALTKMAGGAGFGAALRTGAGTATKLNFQDMPGETAFQQSISLGIAPQTPFQYFTDPSPQIPLQRDSAGNLPPADSTKYPEAIAKLENEQNTALRIIREDQNSEERANIISSLLDSAPTSLLPGSSPTALKPFRNPLAK